MSKTKKKTDKKPVHDYYKNYGITKVKDKKYLKKQELYNLYKKPIKETYQQTPHFNQTYSANVDHQADLLFLPTDNGYKYALVVTDVATRLSDAVPLKSKSSETVINALKTIYNRGILSVPEYLYMDSGSEFKGEVKKYLEENNIGFKYAKTGRHRQIAMVERTNQYLGKALFHRMQAQELLTGKTSREWVNELPKVIGLINKQRKRDPPKVANEPICSGDDCNALEMGTVVRTKLDNPLDYVHDKQLPGKFRATDIRWDPHPRFIANVMFLPGQPPLYQLNDEKDINKIDQSAAYTKGQLQVVPKEEQAPDPSVIRGNPTTFIAEKLVDKKKLNGKEYYKVRWKGFPPEQDTWEPRKNLLEDLPLLVKDFDNKLKNK